MDMRMNTLSDGAGKQGAGEDCCGGGGDSSGGGCCC